ncbi:hypothetical protein [Flavobacterium rhizosphaerae]|uniref:Outer membrane beta-barrel protein n=1 Tax=Flavobacterium rhizosphaerae TaxID=3163298 RepID=A0ABW8YVY2_9FLAO
MSEKKNIDRLFQEKFKDFEVNPPEFVWENIQDKLQQKKQRRVVPLWFKLGGIAAVLIIGFLVAWPFMGTDVNPDGTPAVTNKNETSPGILPKATPGQKPVEPYRHIDEKGIVPPPGDAVVVSEEGNVQQKNNNATSNSTTKQGNSHNTASSVASHTTIGSNNNNATSSQKNSNTPQTAGTGYSGALAGTGDGKIQSVGSTNGQQNNNTDKSGLSGNKQGVATVSTNNTITTAPELVFGKGTATESENKIAGSDASTDIINRETQADEAVAATEVDTTSTAKPENELEKLLQDKLNGKDKNEEVAENQPDSKWDVRPQIAPLFYNSFSEGSPIDVQLAGNAKSYDNTLSYGLGVDYALTDRFTLRSGINMVNLSYATQDIQFYASLDATTSNVSAKPNTATIVVENANNPVNEQLPGLVSLFADQLPQEKFEGAMTQSTGYVEVPVEVSYAVLNKKFGINIIGGVSTLFLNDNSVTVTNTQGLSTNVGQAQNLNNIHFSTNVGLGFKYRFFKAFEASFEPTFKYQVNTFSRDAGNFKPYFIGLYSGVSFSF